MQQHNIVTVYCRRHILPKLRLHCLSTYLDDLLTCDNKDHIADEKASTKPREEADERVHGVGPGSAEEAGSPVPQPPQRGAQQDPGQALAVSRYNFSKNGPKKAFYRSVKIFIHPIL